MPSRASISSTGGQSRKTPHFLDIILIPVAALLLWNLAVGPLSLWQSIFLTAILTGFCYAALGIMFFFRRKRHPAPLPANPCPPESSARDQGPPTELPINPPSPMDLQRPERSDPAGEMLTLPTAAPREPRERPRERLTETSPSPPKPDPFTRFKDEEKTLIQEVQRIFGFPDGQLALSESDLTCIQECLKGLQAPLKMFLDTRFPLKSPEKLFFTFPASLVEGTSKGNARVYFPLESNALAFQGLNLQTPVQPLPEPCKGTLGITSKRLMFSAGGHSFSLSLDLISLVDLSADHLTFHSAGTPKKVSLNVKNPPLILLLLNRCYLE